MASLPCAREPTPCYRYYAVYQTNSLSNRVRALEHIVFRSPAHSGWVRSHGANGCALRTRAASSNAMLCRMSASSRWFWEAVLAR
jgi:hypothetical protein